MYRMRIVLLEVRSRYTLISQKLSRALSSCGAITSLLERSSSELASTVIHSSYQTHLATHPDVSLQVLQTKARIRTRGASLAILVRH